MQPKEKIIKSVHNCFEATKDIVSKNVTSAVRDGKLNIDLNVLSQLLSLVNVSIDDSFHRVHNVFNKELTAALQEINNPVAKKK
jgi:hypothetical protein